MQLKQSGREMADAVENAEKDQSHGWLERDGWRRYFGSMNSKRDLLNLIRLLVGSSKWREEEWEQRGQ